MKTANYSQIRQRRSAKRLDIMLTKKQTQETANTLNTNERNNKTKESEPLQVLQERRVQQGEGTILRLLHHSIIPQRHQGRCRRTHEGVRGTFHRRDEEGQQGLGEGFREVREDIPHVHRRRAATGRDDHRHFGRDGHTTQAVAILPTRSDQGNLQETRRAGRGEGQGPRADCEGELRGFRDFRPREPQTRTRSDTQHRA